MNVYIIRIAVILAAATTAAAAAGPPAGAHVTKDGWFAPRKPHSSPPSLPDKVTRAFVIPIHGPITKTLYQSVRRKVAQCKAKGAELVIFDMNTPGGAGNAMRKIVSLLRNQMQGIYRVAYVNREAYSAGAIISLACHEIVMAPRGVIGDAMPIIVTPQGGLTPLPKDERAKIESPILAEVRDLAGDNGYSEILCQGMVTVKIEVWLIRNRRTRELRVVDAAVWRLKVHGAPAAGGMSTTAPVESPWQYLHTIDREDKLVTMNTREAVRFGFVRYVFPTINDLTEHYAVVSQLTVLGDTWSEKLVATLTSPMVQGVLMFLGILAIYMELQAPGLGLAGGAAVVCFAILFGSHYLIGLAAWWEIALFVLGLLLIGLEIFVIPGFGVAGISGIICCVIGLLAIFVANAPDKLPIPSGALDWSLFQSGVLSLVCAAVLAVVGGAVMMRYLPKIPWASRLILAPVDAPPAEPVRDESPIRGVSVGDRGLVETICRPVGKVRFGDSLLDATTEGGAIEPGVQVRVVRHSGNRLVVEKTEET